MYDSDSDEDCKLIETGIENGEMFESACKSNTQEFLKRDEYIPVSGTVVSKEEFSTLEVVNDIDGVSIRWKDISKGLSLEYTHISLAPRDELDIKPIYPLIKKHLNLQEYGRVGLSNLKRAVGCQVIYDNGWDTWLCFIPNPSFHTSCSEKMFRDMTLANVKRLRFEFERQLFELCLKGVATNTLAKNNLGNARKVFVLPDDRRTMLSILQSSLERTEMVVSGFSKTFYSFRFGEKCKTPVTLPLFDESGVEDICVHVGVSIRDEFHDLLWSRVGVNSVIGRRGNLTSCLSFFECVNFQSNLDERALDVKQILLDICCFPSNVRFVQLYEDTPHRRPRTLVHPVSGAVLLAEGLYRQPSQTKLYRNAEQYLSEIRNNFFQIREGTCRIEFVVVVPTTCRVVSASSFVSKNRLGRLLEEEPMLTPFYRENDIMGYVRAVGLDLCDKLTTIYKTRRGTGDSEAVWQAFQYELAAERLLWSNPFCGTSFRYSVNLGAGLGYPTRCLTDQKGFLCLEDSSACCMDEESTPPLEIYTKNVTVQRQIKRVFGLANYVNATSRVLGRRVVICLLRDLHETGRVFARFEDFLLMLKSSSGNDMKRIVGGMTTKDIGGKLSRIRKAKWPMVFVTVHKILGNDVDKVAQVISEGIRSLELGYFPAFRLHDESRNAGLCWLYKYGLYVLIDDESRVPDLEREAASLHCLVLCELEKMRVCHTSQYEGTVFPWLKLCLEKLAEKKLNRDEKVQVLAFVTSVALLVNGLYVDYLNLSRLERRLPVTQVMLRMLEIQCKFLLSNVNTFRVFRLHQSIPYKLYDSSKLTAKKTEEPKENEKPEYIRDENEFAGMETTDTCGASSKANEVDIVASRHVATTALSKTVAWSQAEVTILETVIDRREIIGTMKARHELYMEICKKQEIPVRTLKAFARNSVECLSSKN